MYKNIVQIPVFIYGASVLALGIASKLKDKAIVIERTGFAGREYVDCYNPGEILSEKKYSKETEALKEELVRRDLLNDNKMHIQGVAPVLFNRIKEKNLNYLFMTVVTEIKPIQGGYEVTVYNNSGFTKFHAEVVIDTTSLCETRPSEKIDIKWKSINATLSPTNKNFIFPMSDNPLVRLVQGRFDDEVYLKYQLHNDDDWISSREKFHKYWVTREGDLKDWNMAALASSFDIKVNTKSEQIDRNWFWVPSSSHDNLLDAYEFGTYTGAEIVLAKG
jgi:hypothetical protein